LLLPGIQIWLDVDNLDDVGRLEESVADAATFIIFLSAGYFESFNCRRELYAALASTRPVITVHEADTAKGGASLAALQAECRENCTEEAPSGHPSYSGPAEVVAAVFEEQDPVVWVRVHAFQLESLKAIALRMLGHFPAQLHSRRSLSVHQAELAAGVMVPGEVGPYAFRGPVTILVMTGPFLWQRRSRGKQTKLMAALCQSRGPERTIWSLSARRTTRSTPPPPTRQTHHKATRCCCSTSPNASSSTRVGA